MVSVCKGLLQYCREGTSCEHFGGYKSINLIPLPLHRATLPVHDLEELHDVMHQSIESPGGGGREMAGRCRAYPV